MTDILPRDLPASGAVNPAAAIIVDGGTTVNKATPIQIVDSAIPLASQAEAEAGTDNAKRVTPLRVKQALMALVSLIPFSYLTAPAASTQTLVAKVAQTVVDPRDAPYSAVAGNTTDQKTALIAAITAAANAGIPFDGGARWYAVSGTMRLDTIPNVNIRRLWLLQVDPAASNCRSLYLTDCLNYTLDGIRINRGSNAASGNIEDYAGLHVSGGYGTINKPEVYGSGKGSGIVISDNTDYVTLNKPFVHDLVFDEPAATDDRINGIRLVRTVGVTVDKACVRRLSGNPTGEVAYRRTRGIVLSDTQYSSVTNAFVEKVDQGIDLTGSGGNLYFEIAPFRIKEVATWGVKAANSAMHGVIGPGIVDRAGYAAVVVQGPSEAGLTYKTSHIDVIGVRGRNTGWNNFVAASPPNSGFICMKAAFDTSFPKAVRFIDCVSVDDQGAPTTKYGAFCDVDYDGGSLLNEVINLQSYGHTLGVSTGFNYRRVKLTGTNPAFGIPTATLAATVSLNWPTETFDGASYHSTVTSTQNVVLKQSGWHYATVTVPWEANAAGSRRLLIAQQGSPIVGADKTQGAEQVGQTVMTVATKFYGNMGDVIRVEVGQSTAGTVAVDMTNATFYVEQETVS